MSHHIAAVYSCLFPYKSLEVVARVILPATYSGKNFIHRCLQLPGAKLPRRKVTHQNKSVPRTPRRLLPWQHSFYSVLQALSVCFHLHTPIGSAPTEFTNCKNTFSFLGSYYQIMSYHHFFFPVFHVKHIPVKPLT